VLDRWNEALDLVERRLVSGVDVAELARTALTSEYHFRRMFSALAGMPLSEYVRRRRITVATAEVVAGAKVLDVAVRYGYGSAEAFSRAFKAVHGLTPGEARRPGAVLHSQPRMSFHLTVRGTSAMRHRIVELAAFRLVGRCARLPLVHRGENRAMVEFHQALPEGLDDRLRALADVPGMPGFLAVSSGFSEGRADGSDFDHHHAVATTTPAAELPDDLDVLDVAAGTWAVFEGRSEGRLREALQNLWVEAFGEWFPSTPYRTAPGPEILTVLERNEDWTWGRGELWLPVEHEPRRAVQVRAPE
jgi:AraC family transcriptional regulator